MEDSELKTLYEHFNLIQKKWLFKFYKHVNSLKTEGIRLSPEFVLEKLLQHTDCQKDLSDMSLITVSNLLQMSPCHCDINQKGELYKRVLLVCKLVPLNTSPGNLCITDHCANTMLCQIIENFNENLISCLHKYCILPSWTLITSETEEKYVEITGPLIVIEPAVKHNICNVLSTADAKLLLENKELLKIESLNFYGKVVVVSEIFRVKNDNLFWVRLNSNVNILVKRQEYLHWQKLLIPQRQYIFTSMRPTTLQKGVGEPVRVYIPWRGSHVHVYTENESVISLKDWLFNADVTDSVQKELFTKQKTSIETAEENNFTYQGVITNDEDASIGVYELDNRVRLYVCYVPVIYSALRQGTKVKIYNAHLKKSNKDEKIRIVCCVSSCIKILEFSENITSSPNSRIPRFIQAVLWKSSYSLKGLIFIADSIFKLKKKFLPYPMEKFEDILHVVHDLIRFPVSTRNYLQEVYTPNHACCFNQDEIDYDAEIPSVCEIDIGEADNKLNDLVFAKHDGSLDWNQSLYWGFKVQHEIDNKVLFGEIHFSSKSAQVQLRDKTGCIDCVVMETHADFNHYHSCGKNCCSCQQMLRSKFTCPFLQPYQSGCLVAITKFYVVNERFLTGSFSDLQNKTDIGVKTSKQLWRKYLVFSMKDVVVISKQKHLCNEPQLNNAKSLTFNETRDKRFYVNHKESLNWNENFKHKPGFSFVLHVCMHLHGKKKETAEENRSLSVSPPEKMSHDIMTQQSQNLTAQIHVGSEVNPRENETCNQCQLFLLNNMNIRYYNVIETGRLYKFSHFETMTAEMKKLPWQLKQSAKKAGNNMCLTLSENIRISGEFHVQDEEPADKVHSIEDVLSNRFSADFVTIAGRIVRRVHHEPDDTGILLKRLKNNHMFTVQDGVSTLDDWQIQLQVKCIKSDSEISVFLKLDNIVYPLGLIPGATVCLEHVERRKSRKGVVYCQYSVVSSVTVLHYHRGPTDLVSNRATNTKADVEEDDTRPHNHIAILPSAYLVDLWQDHSIKDFSCVCFIQKVLNISLKCICQMCGSVVVEDCRNTSCHSDEYKFVTRMRLIIDDGTSVAMVTCSDKDVKTLLLLSEEQWKGLEQSVKSHGEVFLQQTFPEFGTTLEKFVFVLCDNVGIKRSVSMSVRCKHISCNGKEPYLHPAELLNTMHIEDFVMKDINTGLSTIKTRCLPFLQLTCLKVTEIDFMKLTMSFLSDQL